MDNQDMIPLRVGYRRCGDIKYLSHLDMNRLMQRALSRSGLPVWYTQGFNPHMYLTFALPLSLGFESDCEWMDLRLTEPVETEEIITRLQQQMPRGMTVVSAAAPRLDVQDIAWCDYTVTLETPHGAERALALLHTLLEGPLMVEKKTKNGMKPVDIQPLVNLLSACETAGPSLTFSLRCVSGTQTNVNPSLLVAALCEQTGDDAHDVAIVKTAVLTGGGENFC